VPTPYNVSSLDASNAYTLFSFVNNGVGGIFMPMMLLVIWIVAFIGAIADGRQASRGFIFASFIVSILAIPLALIGFLNTQYMYFSFLLVGIGLIVYKLQNAPGM
jgi:hypothetical protein